MDSLLRIAGAVALLLWGTYMVKTAMLRTFGTSLKKQLEHFLSNRISGFLGGTLLAAMLQSSTASALLVAGLQSEGAVSTAMALSAVLGADLGSAIMTRVLTLDVSLAAPVLILTGTVIFLKRSDDRLGQFGRVFLGLGFILIALQFIFAAVIPIKTETAALFDVANHLPVFAFFAGVVLSAASFSSLAAVVLTAGFTANGMLSGTTSLWVLLGANLGSALLAVTISAGGSPTARQAPVGNLIFRTAGVSAGLLFCLLAPKTATILLTKLGLIGCHIGFNAIVGLLGLLFIRPVAHLLTHYLPELHTGASDHRLALTDENLINPEGALQTAANEVHNNFDELRYFWNQLIPLLRQNPPEGTILLLKENRQDILHRCRTLNLFLSALVQQNLSPAETLRWQQVQSVNEAIRSAAAAAGDIVCTLSENKCRPHRNFSSEGLLELLSQHQIVAQNLVFLSRLVLPSNPTETEKTQLQRAVISATQKMEHQEFPLIRRHMMRVAAGLSESEETSALHVELLMLFRRFNALITASSIIKISDR